MITVEKTYYEIIDEDFTGVKAIIKDEAGSTLKTYQNFVRSHYGVDKVWPNQEESFELPSLEVAESMLKSSGTYAEVK